MRKYDLRIITYPNRKGGDASEFRETVMEMSVGRPLEAASVFFSTLIGNPGLAQTVGKRERVLDVTIDRRFGFAMLGPDAVLPDQYSPGLFDSENPWLIKAFEVLMNRGEDSFLKIKLKETTEITLEGIFVPFRDPNYPDKYAVRNIVAGQVSYSVDEVSVAKTVKKARNDLIMRWFSDVRSEVARYLVASKSTKDLAGTVARIASIYPHLDVEYVNQ